MESLKTLQLELLESLNSQIEKINLEIASNAVNKDPVMTLPGIDYYAEPGSWTSKYSMNSC